MSAQAYQQENVASLPLGRVVPIALSAVPAAPCGDDELVRLIRAGDQEAFTTLVQRHRRGVYALARRLLDSDQDAEDAAQETFVRAHARLHTYTPAGRFGSWVLAICAHWCFDLLRARRRHPATVTLEAHAEGPWFISGDTGPEERVMDRAVRAEVRAWLDTLPADYRAVLTLRYDHEYSYAEIAAALDLPVSTIRMRLLRARMALRTIIEPAVHAGRTATVG
jgi:RNA polymerase sigma-70 factor (ECF subfamily)